MTDTATAEGLSDGIPSYTLVHGDGPQALIEFGEVDHVFLDSPFDEEIERRNNAETLRANKFGFAPLTLDLMQASMQAIAMRVRRWSIIKCSDFEDRTWEDVGKAAGLLFLRRGVWVRENSKPQVSGDRPAQGHEYLLFFHSPVGEIRWNAGGKDAVYFAPTVRGAARVHPTQTPDKLLRELIEDFSDEGEIWGDFMMGSCVTGRNAIGLGRRFFGVDNDKRWVDYAQESLRMPLFTAKPLQPELFPCAPASRAARARGDLDRQILRLIQHGPSTRTQIDSAVDATKSEITSSLGRLRKGGMIQRTGKTRDSEYILAVRMQGDPQPPTEAETSIP